MLIENGSTLLKEFDRKHYANPSIIEICEGVWLAKSIGHSNAVIIEAANSVILIDTLDSLERAMQLKTWIKDTLHKEVKTIIYTHIHPDHRGGSQVFEDSNPQIIACMPKHKPFAYSQMLNDVQAKRGSFQFGYGLNDEEALSQGIGPREGIIYGEQRKMLPATMMIEETCSMVMDDVELTLMPSPGEAEDGLSIWLEKQKVMCCGDTYYGCFPNLYAIRGGEYRDIAVWISSLKQLASYDITYLLSGHIEPVIGKEEVHATLINVSEAFEYILKATLEGMNQGKGMDVLAYEIKLPEKYASLPYLQEHYGCVEWSVKAIYCAYLGWFDGNPVHLHPTPIKKKANKLYSLIGEDNVYKAIVEAYHDAEYTWCLELCDMAKQAEKEDENIKMIHKKVLYKLADMETSANGRHYYISAAKEM